MVSADGKSDLPQVSGQSVLDARHAYETVLGKDTVLRALETLPPETRRRYEETSSLSWLDYDVLRAVHDAFEKVSGRPGDALTEEVVPLSVERSFKTVWRIFLRLTSDEALVARSSAIYSRSRSRGTMTARFLGNGEAIAEIRDWASIPPREILVLGIAIRTFLTLAGRKDVRVRGERTASGAKWTLTFRPS